MELEIELPGACAASAGMDGKRPTPIVRDAHTLLVRGIEALERNHIDEAVGLLRQSVELDQGSFYGQLALGVALTKALKIPEAERALEAAIGLEPRNFWAHLRMAEFFQRVGVPTKSQEELQIALDVAATARERQVARNLLEADKRQNPKRAWRPDFLRLRRKKRGDE